MFFNLGSLAKIANALLIFWLIWQVAFMRGYQEAENDLSKKGYNFHSAQRAFE